jgi:hypothetical protein
MARSRKEEMANKQANRRPANKQTAGKTSMSRRSANRWTFGVVGLVMAVVFGAVLIVGSSTHGPSAPKGEVVEFSGARASVVAQLASVPNARFDAVGTGGLGNALSFLTGSQAQSGKVDVIYVGADFCPFCAAERWALAVALDRFGSFSGLQEGSSAGPKEVYPWTATLGFHQARYTSPYVTFAGIETMTRTHAALDTLAGAPGEIFAKYDSSQSYPFIYIGGRFLQVGAGFSPGLLAGLNQAQIATDVASGRGPVANAVLGSANYLTAAICASSTHAPQVCSTPGVKAALAALGQA